MIRSSISTATALLILGATAAHAEMLNVTFSGATGQNPLFGGLSFNIDTAATTNTFTTGPCVAGGQPSDIYQTFSASGGISNAALIWNGVDYSLQSSSIFLDPEGPGGTSGSCPFALDMTLTFNNGTVFRTNDQSAGVFSASQYSPSQMLATRPTGQLQRLPRGSEFDGGGAAGGFDGVFGEDHFGAGAGDVGVAGGGSAGGGGSEAEERITRVDYRKSTNRAAGTAVTIAVLPSQRSVLG